MHPDKVRRDRLARLEDLPNIGPAMARDLHRLGIEAPADLAGQDPYEMYERLSRLTCTRQDPCVLDVFLSVVRFMAGDPARPWWAYTAERQRTYPGPGAPTP
ncbi:MAG: helix-hairpin-helix domain-containing protein [Betaproteobacteria bacterium]|nr:helix-hairpin-helix domain-containing protein [Betaproteobacteria bacterium]